MAEEVEALLEMMAMGWGLMDSECSAVLSEQSKEIAEKLTGLLVRSPRLLARMREAGLIGDWAKFAMAIGPVLKAVWSHHVARPLREEEDEGVFDPSRFAPYRPQ